MEEQVVYRLRDSQLEWLELEGEVVALDSHNSQYLGTNASGAALWKALAVGATRSDLVEELTGIWDLERDRAEADVDAFLETARQQDLLEEG